MNIHFNQNYHTTRELIAFLFEVYNDRDFVNFDETTNITTICQRIFEQIKKVVPVKEEFKKFFLPYNEKTACLADLMIYTFLQFHECDTLDFDKKLLHKFSTYDLQNFPYFSEVSTCGFLLDSTKPPRPFMQSIKELELNDSYKMEICYAFYDFENHFRQLYSLFKETLELIQPILDQYLDIQQNVYQNFQQLFNPESIQEILTFYFMPDDHQELYIYPSLSHHISVSLYVDENDLNAPYYFFAGVSVSHSQIFHNFFAPTKERVQNFLKVLSDPSKLEIVMLLKEKTYFGGELAKAMNLTTPTISHHMNQIIPLGFINIKKESNRVYYSLNKENLNSYLKQLHKSLLQ